MSKTTSTAQAATNETTKKGGRKNLSEATAAAAAPTGTPVVDPKVAALEEALKKANTELATKSKALTDSQARIKRAETAQYMKTRWAERNPYCVSNDHVGRCVVTFGSRSVVGEVIARSGDNLQVKSTAFTKPRMIDRSRVFKDAKTAATALAWARKLVREPLGELTAQMHGTGSNALNHTGRAVSVYVPGNPSYPAGFVGACLDDFVGTVDAMLIEEGFEGGKIGEPIPYHRKFTNGDGSTSMKLSKATILMVDGPMEGCHDYSVRWECIHSHLAVTDPFVAVLAAEYVQELIASAPTDETPAEAEALDTSDVVVETTVPATPEATTAEPEHVAVEEPAAESVGETIPVPTPLATPAEILAYLRGSGMGDLADRLASSEDPEIVLAAFDVTDTTLRAAILSRFTPGAFALTPPEEARAEIEVAAEEHAVVTDKQPEPAKVAETPKPKNRKEKRAAGRQNLR